MTALGGLRKRLFGRGAPLAVQMVALLIGGLVVAQGVTLGLTLLLPPKPAAEYKLDDIARALKGGALRVDNPRPLVRRLRREPPSTQSAGWLVSERSRADLARLVGAAPDDVRLLFYSPLPFAGASGLALGAPRAPRLATASFILGQGPVGGGGPGAGAGSFGAGRSGGAFGAEASGSGLASERFGRGGVGRGSGRDGGGRRGAGLGAGGLQGAGAGRDAGGVEHGLSAPAPQAWNAQGPVIGGLGPRGAELASSLIAPVTPPVVQSAPRPVATPTLAPAAAVEAPLLAAAPPPPLTRPTLTPPAVSATQALTAAPAAPTIRQAAAPAPPKPVEAEHDGYRLPDVQTTGRGLFGLAPAPFVQGDFVAALRTGPNSWLTVQPQPEPFPNAWQRRVLLWFLISFAAIVPLGLLFARRLVSPLEDFAAAAERLGRDPSGAVIPLRGPAEIGRAAKAFNQMQSRLKRYIDDRTAMVGAISHDLRTPLARMRFRLERAPASIRDPVLSDIAQMEEMISSVLVFIRDASEPAVRERVDLRSILECVVDDAALMGADASLESGDPLPVDVDSLSVQRVLTNLVDNALKYGDRAHARMYRDGEEVVAEIVDGGPGLPDDELERVFLPFYRSESARTLEKGGIGLGLAVSRSVARAHGGDVRLQSDGQGLHAQLRLPLATEIARAA